jgi:hypothetical protein
MSDKPETENTISETENTISETENPKPETAPAANGVAAAPRAVEFEDIVGWAQHPLTLLTKGIFASSTNLPVEAVIMAVATAMGRVLSEGTASDVPAMTIALRAKLVTQFTDNLKKHVPAFRPANTPIGFTVKPH